MLAGLQLGVGQTWTCNSLPVYTSPGSDCTSQAVCLDSNIHPGGRVGVLLLFLGSNQFFLNDWLTDFAFFLHVKQKSDLEKNPTITS